MKTPHYTLILLLLVVCPGVLFGQSNTTTISAGAAAPATISSLSTVAPGTTVFNFDINDDFAGNDAFPTLISSIFVTEKILYNTVANWSQVLAGATLEDDLGNSLAAGTISTNHIEFSSIPLTSGTLGYVADGATKHYHLKVYLRSALLGSYPATIDGMQFGFEVLQSNILTAANSTMLVPAQNTNSGDANAVSVVATALRFNHPPVPMTAALDLDFPGVVVEAIDANGNRDLNFNSTVRGLTNVSGAVMINAPIVGSTQFTAGLLNFANNFRFASGNNNDDVTLTIKSGQTASTICGTDFTTHALCATSNQITLLSSFESSIIGDPTYTYATNIQYLNHQAADIMNSATSLEIARMLLVDGSRVNFAYGPVILNTGTESDGLPNTDIDGAATQLTSLTLRITNPSNIRRIALYNGTTELAGTEQVVFQPAGTPFYDFTFTGSPLVVAPDDALTPLSVLVSFRDTAPEVTDQAPIHVSVVAAVLSTGSQFYNSPPNIAGVSGGFASSAIAPTANKINVIATKLDFVMQPAPFAGINQPVSLSIVEARDPFGIVDLDFNNVAALTAGVPINGSFVFSSGRLELMPMHYVTAGDGTITVYAGSLSSNTNNTVGGLPNVSIPCAHVDVLHVSASYNPSGVVTATNLVGGTANKVIFGFTFNAPTTITGQPRIDKFTISFSSPINGVFLNPRIFEHTTSLGVPGSFASAIDITTLGIPAPIVSTQALTVNLSGSPRDLSLNTYSYFLVVDIDPSASGTTPMMTVSLIDGGFGSSTNNNISIHPGATPSAFDKPSSTANIQGQTYTFASIFPPTLVSSYPALAQSNVDPNQSTLELTFSVPVFSLDQRVMLHEELPGGSTGALTTLVLLGPNGDYQSGNPAALPAQPIIFSIPAGFLVPDREYFVTIAQGIFNGSGGTGIMDAANNLFPGFVNPGTLYFRTTNNIPPKLLGTASIPLIPPVPSDPSISDLSATGATLNAIFDKPGKAFFLVLNGGSTPPVVSGPTNQIKNPGTYPAQASVAASGSFDVSSTNPVSQFGIIAPTGGVFTPGLKDVWIYGEGYSEFNHILTPIPNTAAFGSIVSNFIVGEAGPTLQFTAPAVITGPVSVNMPDIAICKNSFQILNSPIIISEGANSQFNAGLAVQTMNIVLPAGFEFDVTLNGTIPQYGNIVLEGADFVGGSGQLGFLGNTILTIQYKNNGAATRDRIIITGLRVRSMASASGPIYRLGGNALTGFIPDSSPLGTISSFDAPSITFDNSYSSYALGISQPGPVVTMIPDNTIPNFLLLTPYIDPASNDFGPSSFSGQGVTENVLNLAAVTTDVPFNITITHTDNNGCISHNSVQYTVYSHLTAVNISQGGLPDQGPYCSTNPNFVPDQINVAPTNLVVRNILYDNIPGYWMESLVATIPAGSTIGIPDDPNGPIINSTSFAGAWTNLIQTLPVLTNTYFIGGREYKSYKFDEAQILNAHLLSIGTIPDPYSFFRQVSPQGQTYYTGGSLGLVEFTGVYRSQTNPLVAVPRRQLVEFFLPAVPIVEVAVSNQPVPGTRVYCESGGVILISGYPAASGGTTASRFTITDDPTGSIIYDANYPFGPPITPPGFVDNGNGTATLDPALLKNGYKKMKITYYFQQDNSPCPTTASIDLQVAPNPVSIISAPSASICIGTTANFFGGGSTIAGTGNSIVSYQWVFGGGSSTAATSTPAVTLAASAATTFQATLVTISNLGCQSAPATLALPIGGVQSTSFEFTNGTTTSPFAFVNTSSLYQNDNFAQVTWNFGDGSPPSSFFSNFNFPASHFYTTPGTYTVALTVTSTQGCTGIASQNITVAPAQPNVDPPPVTPPVVVGVGSTASEITLGENYPNPFTESTQILLALPGVDEEFDVGYDLYDSQGKRMLSSPVTRMHSGLHTLEINTVDNRISLPAGLYLFQARIQGRSEGGVFVRKVTVE